MIWEKIGEKKEGEERKKNSVGIYVRLNNLEKKGKDGGKIKKGEKTTSSLSSYLSIPLPSYKLLMSFIFINSPFSLFLLIPPPLLFLLVLFSPQIYQFLLHVGTEYF